MAVVKDYWDGDCHIIIDDNYCTYDNDEIQLLLDKLSYIYSKHYTEQSDASLPEDKHE